MSAVVVLLDSTTCVERVLFDSSLHAAHLHESFGMGILSG